MIFSFYVVRIALTFLLFWVTAKVFCQEKVFTNPAVESILSNMNPHETVEKTIAHINAIKNIAYICKNESTIPYLPTVFHQPYISKTVVAMNQADTVQGAAYKLYVLDDTFRLRTIYDGRYDLLVDPDQGKATIVDLAKHPSSRYRKMGPLHLRIKTLLENAVRRNAEIKTVAVKDSLTIAITFKDLQIEFAPVGVLVAKDTLGFMSRYTVYVDPYTYLPIKSIRHMPYHTFIETILYQRSNFTDTLIISVQDDDLDRAIPGEEHLDSLIESNVEGSHMKDWKLMEVAGDTIQFSKVRGEKVVLVVLNSIGWKPCVQAIPFLKRLKRDYADADFELVCIEPFIHDIQVMRNYKVQHRMNYPLLLADAALKRQYAFSHIPVFMILDQKGIIRKVFKGFNGKTSESAIRSVIEDHLAPESK